MNCACRAAFLRRSTRFWYLGLVCLDHECAWLGANKPPVVFPRCSCFWYVLCMEPCMFLMRRESARGDICRHRTVIRAAVVTIAVSLTVDRRALQPLPGTAGVKLAIPLPEHRLQTRSTSSRTCCTTSTYESRQNSSARSGVGNGILQDVHPSTRVWTTGRREEIPRRRGARPTGRDEGLLALGAERPTVRTCDLCPLLTLAGARYLKRFEFYDSYREAAIRPLHGLFRRGDVLKVFQ